MDRTGDGNEAIPPPRYRFDEARLAGVIIERHPKLADRGSQYRVGNELVAPNFIEQSVRSEQGAGLPHERAQDREGRRSERDGRTVTEVARLDEGERRHELAQMLAGASGAESALGAADALLAGAAALRSSTPV